MNNSPGILSNPHGSNSARAAGKWNESNHSTNNTLFRDPGLVKNKITKRTHFQFLTSICKSATYANWRSLGSRKRTHFGPRNSALPPFPSLRVIAKIDFRKELLSLEHRHLVNRSDHPQPSVSFSATKWETFAAWEVAKGIRPKAEAREGRASGSERVTGSGVRWCFRVQGGEASAFYPEMCFGNRYNPFRILRSGIYSAIDNQPHPTKSHQIPL